ncbi:DUF1134 domain-containing protein [Fundidesulfovibrio terrae]|uniref:DUF1134 domain-containing protein n=1 Tax=Fundidesulfovibrio terrae TaxID=2922866 RepID=UPI001FAF20DB|nr:DUF1134 domain-containing protein [Fundidesulfovibrio terrae]
MKKTAALLLLLTLACAATAAYALQERTITDEPSVDKPQAPANQSAPAPAAPAAPAPAEKAPAPSAPDKAPAKAEPPSYQPATKPFGSDKPASNGSWTPGGAKEPAPVEPAPAAGSSTRVTEMPEAKQVQVSTYSRKEVDEQVMGFFEGGARGLADLITRAFEKYGEPTGFIKGNEGAGALVVGLRYGEGWLHLKNGQKVYVYWQSPSVGFDLGVNASKVFCLVYGMTDVKEIFQRYPSVDGSAYVVGGFGMNYQRSGSVTLAPIRFGVGLRLGANVGYMHFTRERTINPF